MSWSDVGSALQMLGGVIEVGALIWAAKRIDHDLRWSRWEHSKARLDTQVEVMAKAFTGDPKGAERTITRFLSDQIDNVYDSLEKITSTPLRLFIAGIIVNVVGVSLSSGWF